MKRYLIQAIAFTCAVAAWSSPKNDMIDDMINSLRYFNQDEKKTEYYGSAEGFKELWMRASEMTTTYYRVSALKMSYYLMAGTDYAGTLKTIEAGEETLELAEASRELDPIYRDYIVPAYDSEAAWLRRLSRNIKQVELFDTYAVLAKLYIGIEEFEKARAIIDRLEARLPERFKYMLFETDIWLRYKTVDLESAPKLLEDLRKKVTVVALDLRDDDREVRDLFYQYGKYIAYVGLKNIEAMMLHFLYDFDASAALYERMADEITQEFKTRKWTGGEKMHALFLGNASYVRIGNLDLDKVDRHYALSGENVGFGHYEMNIESLRMRNKADKASAFIDSIYTSDARAARLEFGVGWKLLYRGIIRCQDGDFERGLTDLETAAKVRETFLSNSYSIMDFKQLCYTELAESFARKARYLGFRYGAVRWFDVLGSWAKSAYYSFLSVVNLPRNNEFRSLLSPYFFPRDRPISYYAMPELVKALGHNAFSKEIEKLKVLDSRPRIGKYYDLLLALNAIYSGDVRAAEDFIRLSEPYQDKEGFDPGVEGEYASLWEYAVSMLAERGKDKVGYSKAVDGMYRNWPQSVPFLGRNISFEFHGVDEVAKKWHGDAVRMFASIDVPGVELDGTSGRFKLSVTIAPPPADADASVLYELRVEVKDGNGIVLSHSATVTESERKPGRLEDLVFGSVFGMFKIARE